MQFLLTAYDGDDDDALARRNAVRADHIACGDKLSADGKHIVGAAILDDDGNMRGSVLIVEFPSRDELDAWLAEEPYVLGNVWQTIDIVPCALGPSFQHVLRKKSESS